MRIYRLSGDDDSKELLRSLGVERGGVEIMSKKMELFHIFIGDLKTPGANILKQDALSIGAELAVPRGTVNCTVERVDCILIANRVQLEILSKKELSQPFGLKEVGKRLREFLIESKRDIKIMAVINANSDSFYEGSRYMGDEAKKAILKAIDDGADIIDIGAVSSRPGSEAVSVEEEMRRFAPIADMIRADRLYEKALFSIDSYTPEVVEYAMKCGFRLINDITGASNTKLIELGVEYGAKYCIMHMQGNPKTMQLNPSYKDVTDEVDRFFQERIEKCESFGMSRDDIILDVGIGFGKSLEHNLRLLKNHKHFLHFGCELLIGASRKSLIDKIIPTPTEERLPGTLAIHLKAVERGATIVRCHDVAEHKQALSVWSRL